MSAAIYNTAIKQIVIFFVWAFTCGVADNKRKSRCYAEHDTKNHATRDIVVREAQIVFHPKYLSQ